MLTSVSLRLVVSKVGAAVDVDHRILSPYSTCGYARGRPCPQQNMLFLWTPFVSGVLRLPHVENYN